MPDTHKLTVQTESVIEVPQDYIHRMARNLDDSLRKQLEPVDLANVFDIDADGWRAPGTLIQVEGEAQEADVHDLAVRIYQHFHSGQPFPELPAGWYWVDEDVVLVAMHQVLAYHLTFSCAMDDLADHMCDTAEQQGELISGLLGGDDDCTVFGRGLLTVLSGRDRF